MKKLLISFLALALSFGCFAQQFNLGKVSFATDSVWIILGNGVSQIWSDAVQTDTCSNRTEFRGRKRDTLRPLFVPITDCRSNPNQKGDLFSWLAVSEFKNVLCPYPWRVPTKQDFINLDIALGGTGKNRGPERNDPVHIRFIQDNYIPHWGLSFGGYSVSTYPWFSDQGWVAYYWSQSERDCGAGIVYKLGISCCDIHPQGTASKAWGYSLRCVRDN